MDDSIRVTEYSRSHYSKADHLTASGYDGSWRIFCRLGPSWIWNNKTKEWEIITGFSVQGKGSLDEFEDGKLTEKQALDLLKVLKSKKQLAAGETQFEF